MKAFTAVLALLLIALVNADTSKNPTTPEPTTTSQPLTTVKPVPPSPPKPTPTPVTDTVNFALKTGEFYEAIGSFQGAIHFTTKNTNQSFDLKLTSETSLLNSSSAKKEEIIVGLAVNGQENQVLTFTLNKKNKTYSLDKVTFAFRKNQSDAFYIGEYNGTLFEVSSDHSFLCQADQTIDFAVKTGDKLTLELKNLKFDAFRSSNSTELRSATECEADNAKNDFVPLAVGAALVALVVIVLIAFLIGRKRSRRLAYESV